MPSPTSLLVGCSLIALVGCGSASASNAGSTPSAPGSGAPGRGAGGGTTGQLVQVNGTELTLSTTSGDVTVAYSASTTIVSASTGSPADIVAGSCVVIAGLRDPSGAVSATTVRLSRPVDGSCQAAGPGGGPVPGRSPRAFPSSAGRPSGAPTPNPNATFLAGMVTAVAGTVVTVQSASGTTSSVTVPTTLSVTESSPGTAADLVVDSCVRAIGRKDGTGIVQATSLTVQPTNSSGTCTFGGFGGRGGFGGGGTPPSPAT